MRTDLGAGGAAVPGTTVRPGQRTSEQVDPSEVA